VSALVVVAAACGSGGASTSSPGAGGPVANEEAGERASATFTADQLDGGEFASTSLAGKDTVLWFWAPWCTVCRGEAPDVVASAEALAGRVEIIGVAGRGGVPEMHDFVSDTDTGSLTHVVDADGSIWSQYGVFAQPAYAFIDDGGEVEVFVGAMGEEALTERMNALAEA
jgi:thiol-disulfide isomerase/thioredoxin